MEFEGVWPVFRQGQQVGACHIGRQGLYWQLQATCDLTDGIVYRLMAVDQRGNHCLGVPVPVGQRLCLNRKIALRNIHLAGPWRLELWSREDQNLWESGVATPDSRESGTPEEAAGETLPGEAVAGPEVSPAPEEGIFGSPKELSGHSQVPEEAAPAATPGNRPLAEEVSAEEIVPEETPAEGAIPEESFMEEEVPEEAPAEVQDSGEISAEETALEMAHGAPEGATTSKTDPDRWAAETVQKMLLQGVIYEAGKPLPPMEAWEQLRVVSDGKGGLFLATKEGLKEFEETVL